MLPDFAPGVVLICGHMSCASCWGEYAAHQFAARDRDEALRLSCPICRAALTHPLCGCGIDGLSMPRHPSDETVSAWYRQRWGGEGYRYAEDRWAEAIPRTLTDGGEIPGACELCGGDEA